ncbi:MAG TPA: glycosyltransferase family 2 protein [Pyrinomonadaceae bacterium]|nr:glycosyltransferase family 2 protein [Pyrinomonadaceae bacterium]
MATPRPTKPRFRARQATELEPPQRPPLISIVAPAHNEEESLPVFVQKVSFELADKDHEIIIVDDGSTDRTWSTIVRLKKEYPGVRGVRFTRNFGHQSAILAGLAEARGGAVIMMDSDGQHPESLIPEMIKQWSEGYDVVQAVRTKTDKEGVLKKISSNLFYRILVKLSGVNVPHGSADFRLLSRTVVDAVLHSAGSQLFLRGLIPWMGFPTVYVPFEAARRMAGRSSYTWKRMIRLSVDGLMTFSIIPLRMAIMLGISVSALSFLYLVYIIVIWATSSQVVHGWASMTGLLSFLGGIQLITVGVVGEYLGRLYISNLNRPHFVVKEQL